ncbi:MAG: trans-aconitate 2-methyltransferase [Candidatus Berkiella sp.]
MANDIFSSNILDVGCGLGHLIDYLKNHHFTGIYKGIDIVDQMVVLARKRHPTFHFETNDIDSILENKHDYVLASGIFALTPPDYVKELIPVLFARAIKGLAFNCLSSRSQEKEEGMYYQIPGDIFHFCKKLTHKVKLREDYLSHDFTIYMQK